MGDEFGQHGGADPDNRRMLNFDLTDHQQDLHDFTSGIANVRLENEALRRGVYSTYHVESDVLAYEMTSENQRLLVVLNRGGETQMSTDYDEFIFGSSQLDNGLLSVPADSVLILEKTGTEAEENPDDNQTIEENNSTQENDSTDVNETGNVESNNTVDENQLEEEMRVCDGCCGETFELPITEQCPIVSCEDCEELQADVESKSSSSEIVRNLLVIIVVISLLAFIQMNRRSDDNH
tara:strand:- start:686 stop:1396 length:711 start_codon:yes stop_codon:yes gene_type:complete